MALSVSPGARLSEHSFKLCALLCAGTRREVSSRRGTSLEVKANLPSDRHRTDASDEAFGPVDAVASSVGFANVANC